MENSSNSGNFMMYRDKEDAFAMDETESDLLDTPTVPSTPGAMDADTLLASPHDLSEHQEVSNLRQESIKTYLLADPSAKKPASAIAVRSKDAEAMAVVQSIRSSPRPTDQPISRPDLPRSRIFGQSEPDKRLTPVDGPTGNGTVPPKLRLPLDGINQLDQSETSNTSGTFASTAGLNDAILADTIDSSGTSVRTRDAQEVNPSVRFNFLDTSMAKEAQEVNPSVTFNFNPQTVQNPFDGPPADPKPQRKGKKLNKSQHANKRTRAERGSVTTVPLAVGYGALNLWVRSLDR